MYVQVRLIWLILHLNTTLIVKKGNMIYILLFKVYNKPMKYLCIYS